MEGQAVSEDGNKRMANLDLLRCVAMMMVVVLHYLGKGGLLPELHQPWGAPEQATGVYGVAAWTLETLCIVAVNVYMFISGYFLSGSAFKLSRLLQLYIQVWAYSVVFGLVGALTGVVAETATDTHYLLTLVFPVTMGHYWFMTAYVFLYLLLPFVGMAVRQMTKRQLQTAAVLLFLVFSIAKSVLPLRLEMDGQGYDCLWYLCVFVSAAYIRRFGIPFLKKRGRGICLYAACCLLAFTGTMALRFIYIRTGSIGRMTGMCLEYNHILPFLGALGLFCAFARMEINGKIADVIKKIGPYTLGVYLLHENLGLRYTWQPWFGSDRIHSVGELLLFTLLAAVGVFIAGILVDMLRAGLMAVLHRLLYKLKGYRKLIEKIERVDNLF